MAITACRIFPALERLKHKDPETLASQYSLREKNIKEKKMEYKKGNYFIPDKKRAR